MSRPADSILRRAQQSRRRCGPQRTPGAAVLIATHDLDFAHGLGARILPMRDGVAPSSGTESAPTGAATAQGATAQRTETAQRTAAPRFIDRQDIPDCGKTPPHPDAAAAELAVLAAANLLALAAFCWPLLAAALPEDAAAALPYAALAIAPLAVVAVVVSPRRLGPFRTHGGVARRPGRRRFRGAGGEHRRRGRGGGLYPADPGRPGVRCPFRHAPRRRHHRRLKRLVGWHRPVDTVPDFRLRVGGRRGRPAPARARKSRARGCCAATASWRPTCSAC